MFRRLLKNKKAQNTAEYAILIALVIAGIVAMQTYAQRTLQARVRDASDYLITQTNNLGTTKHYEPYYKKDDYTVDRESSESELLNGTTISRVANDTTTRREGGTTESIYKGFNLINGI